MARRRFQPRLLRIVIILVLALTAWSTWQRRQLGDDFASLLPNLEPLDDCAHAQDLGNVAVTVKTGATEAKRLIPTLLKTSLRCVKRPIIVSDLEQEIAGHKLHDVLKDFTPRAVAKNPDFDLYFKQQKLKAEGREKDIPSLASLPIADEDWRTKGKTAAWGLDKYKNIRMVDLAWRMQPDREWYVFIDADSYLLWGNLLAWLPTLNHSKPMYIGQPVRMREHRPRPLDFAYGGAGIILSRAAVRIYAEEREGMLARWDKRIETWWFGDFLLADLLDEELDLLVTDGTPMLGADSPASSSYGVHNWCRPVVTMHHLEPADARALHKLDRKAAGKVIKYKDVYSEVPRESLPKVRTDWDNRAEEDFARLPMTPHLAGFAHQSVAMCETACQLMPDCLQYIFVQENEKLPNNAVKQVTSCSMSKMFKLGQARPLEEWGDKKEFSKTWTSGWNGLKILAWRQDHGTCPDRPETLWQLGPGIHPNAT